MGLAPIVCNIPEKSRIIIHALQDRYPSQWSHDKHKTKSKWAIARVIVIPATATGFSDFSNCPPLKDRASGKHAAF
jgi:hypothetical protein